jgi:transposase
MKDGLTHLAYKPEHAVDQDTGAIVSADIQRLGNLLQKG